MTRWTRRSRVPLVLAAVVVLGLLATFAIELSDTQANSETGIRAQVHQRSVLAAALIDSLIGSVEQGSSQYEVSFGGRAITPATMNASRGQNAYLVLLDASGRVLASSAGVSSHAREELSSGPVAMVRSGRPYAVGNVVRDGGGGVVNLAVAFSTRFGRRILVSGFRPVELGTLLDGELRSIHGVSGAHNYVIDANDTVLASSNPQIGTGYRFTDPVQVRALAHASGERNGHYYDEVRLANSTWRIVLSAPSGPLFASVTGLRKWVPWLILIAFGVVAVAALALGRRVLLSAETELRQTNLQLANANQELAVSYDALGQRAVELERSNSELDQFASIASHDLQEPLRKVRTFTEQLAVSEADRLSDRGRDYLERANRAAERMQTLVQDLLRFSRVTTQARPFVAVDLAQIAREAVSDLSLEPESAQAIVQLGELPTITADPLQMRQLMQNLISNALKFRREGQAPEVRIDATVHDGLVRLTIADNGIGFEPRYATRIFRVFERLVGRNEYPGTGIGLALCRKIAERHGGEILAEGELGVGATFTVTLPLHRPAPAVVAAVDVLDHTPLDHQPEPHVHA
jgi:signal transduction histidine kinase